MKTIAIAIDGPAGAGKSTLAKALAKELQYIYVDTGALYRAIGLYTLRQEKDPHDAAAVTPLLAGLQVELRFENGEQHVYANGEDVSGEIRTPAVSMAASAVSAIPAVRQFLFDLQRDIAQKNCVIMDGRDIGTVVLPWAQIKIFLSASPEARARRRFDELQEKGQEVSFDEVLADMQKRDYDDTHRAIAPLKQAEDAVPVDTSTLSLEQSIALLTTIVKERLACLTEN
mgnify:FL=1